MANTETPSRYTQTLHMSIHARHVRAVGPLAPRRLATMLYHGPTPPQVTRAHARNKMRIQNMNTHYYYYYCYNY